MSRARRFAYLALQLASTVLRATERAGKIMDINKLIYSLEETISFLQNSQPSGWANMSIEEIIQELDSEIAKAKNSRPIDTKRLSFLFAPTGAIQETSIDNRWGDEFLRISEIVDQFTRNG